MKQEKDEKHPWWYRATVIIFFTVACYAAFGLLIYGLRKWLNP